MKYKITLLVEGDEPLKKSLNKGTFQAAIAESVLEPDEKILHLSFAESKTGASTDHVFAD